MFDSLFRDLGAETIRRLDETTVALAVAGGRRAGEISIDPPERLIGHNRQEYVRSGFNISMLKQGFEITEYSAAPGAPAVHFVAGDTCNFTCISTRIGAPPARRNRTLAAICSERLPKGVAYADLFGELHALQPTKPVFAFLTHWRRARAEDAEIPYWTGFVRLRAVDERTVIVDGSGVSFGDALLRAQQIELGALEVAASEPVVRLRRRAAAA